MWARYLWAQYQHYPPACRPQLNAGELEAYADINGVIDGIVQNVVFESDPVAAAELQRDVAAMVDGPASTRYNREEDNVPASSELCFLCLGLG